MPTWPGTLPQVLLRSGYQETQPKLVVRTNMDAGPAKVRRRFTANVTPVKGKIIVTADQLSTLVAFWSNDCAGGALQFVWQTQWGAGDTDQVTDSDAESDTDLLFQAANYRFVSEPTYAEVGFGTYEVDLSLEMMP